MPQSQKDRDREVEQPLTPLSPMDDETIANSSTTNQKFGNSINSTNNNSDKSGAGPDWQLVCRDKEYTPTADDVGSRLRVEVRAVAVADGEVLAGPVSIYTDSVLQSPSAPPKRVSCLFILK